MSVKKIQRELQKLSNKEKVKILQRFFKTGPGEYGEGDIFLGVTVPKMRSVVKEYTPLNLNEILRLLKSPIHEERLTALLLLVQKYKKSDNDERGKIYNLYLKNTQYINNWDLIDLSAEHIVGGFLLEKDKKLLYQLARSRSLWKRRISILATFHFIRNQRFTETLKIACILLNDEEDLIHKGVGWMLREVGKRDMATEENFLKKHYRHMPRTMLRYAIERFPEKKRKVYLRGTI